MLLKVAIIGAGPGGVACAAALQRRGHHVRVFERRGRLGGPAGHGWLLMPNGVKALTSLGAEGLLGTCTALDSLELQVWDGHGADSSTCTRSSLPPGVHCTTRKAIVDGVAHLLSPGTITHGFQVAGFDMEGDSLRRVSRVRLASDQRTASENAWLSELFCRPGREAPVERVEDSLSEANQHDCQAFLEAADLFIGADGHRSLLFKRLNPGRAREMSPVHEIITSAQMPELAAALGSAFQKTEMLSRGAACGLLAPDRETVLFFLQYSTALHGECRDIGDCISSGCKHKPDECFIRKVLGSILPPNVATYLDEADFTHSHVCKPINADLPDVLHGQNCVLVGDARCPLLPFTSQGVSSALEDAVLLARMLDDIPADGKAEAISRALADFIETRRPVVARCVDDGREQLARFVSGQVGEPRAPYTA